MTSEKWDRVYFKTWLSKLNIVILIPVVIITEILKDSFGKKKDSLLCRKYIWLIYKNGEIKNYSENYSFKNSSIGTLEVRYMHSIFSFNRLILMKLKAINLFINFFHLNACKKVVKSRS